MKTVRQAKPFPGCYSINAAKIMQARDGTFRCVGGGFAGKFHYRMADSAARAIESHAGFCGWEA